MSQNLKLYRKNVMLHYKVVQGLNKAYTEYLLNKKILHSGNFILDACLDNRFFDNLINKNFNFFVLHIASPKENTINFYKDQYNLNHITQLTEKDYYILETDDLETLHSLLKLQGYID